MSALYPSSSTFSLPGSAPFSAQQQAQQQQLLLQQQQQFQLPHSNATSMPMINAATMNLAATRDLHMQRWLQSNSNFYQLYHNTQSRAGSAISGISGRSSVSGIPDDVSTISHMSAWNMPSPSLCGSMKLLSSTASADNLGPSKRNVELDNLHALCDFNCDGDEKLLMEWASTVLSIVNRNAGSIKDHFVHLLARRIITQLSGADCRILNHETCDCLLQCFLKLSRTTAFEKMEVEFAYGIFTMYRNLMTRRINRILQTLHLLRHSLNNSADALKEATGDKEFIQHICRVIASGKHSKILHSALSIARQMLRIGANFENLSLEVLLNLTRCDKSDILRLSALDTIGSLVKYMPNMTGQFIRAGGIEFVFENVVIENFREEKKVNLKYTQHALSVLRDVSCDKAIADSSINLGVVVQNLVQLMFFLRQQLDPQCGRIHSNEKNSLLLIAELTFGFIRNVLARNVDALVSVSMNEELFRGIAKFLRETVAYLLQVRNDQQQQTWQNAKNPQKSYDAIVLNIFDDTLTALTGLNKECNPQRQAASHMIDNSAELRDLIQFLADSEYHDLVPYQRFVKCWYNMLSCGISPTQPNIIACCLLRYIRIWIRHKQERIVNREKDFTSQKAFEVLAKVVECLHHYENITSFFKGEVNLFALLNKVDERECVAILNLIDVISSKDYSLLLAWADLDTSIIELCEASTNIQIATLSQKIQRKLKCEDYSMNGVTISDVIMTGFGSFGQ